MVSPEGEKQGSLLAPLHAHSHTLVFGAARAWVGQAWHPRSCSPFPNPACRATGLSTSLVSSLYLVPSTGSCITKPLGAASLQLWSWVPTPAFFYLSCTVLPGTLAAPFALTAPDMQQHGTPCRRQVTLLSPSWSQVYCSKYDKLRAG